MAAFVSERVPSEIIALAVLCVLAASGVVDTSTAFSGFSSDAVVAVGAMFVSSAALEASGALGDFIRIGLPLNILFWMIASACIPIFFPFQAMAN